MTAYTIRHKHTKELAKIIDREHLRVFWWTKRKAECIMRPPEVIEEWLKKFNDKDIEMHKVPNK